MAIERRGTSCAVEPLVLRGNELAAGESRDQVVGFLSGQRLCHFTQHPDWACLHHADEFVGIGTLLKGQLMAWTLVRIRRIPILRLVKYFAGRGPVVGNISALSQHLIDLVQVLSGDGLYLAMHPYQFEGSAAEIEAALLLGGGVIDSGAEQYYRDTLVIDLTQNLESIRANFRKSVIRQLNKSARVGVTVVEMDSDSDRQQFVTDYTAAMVAKQIAVPDNFQQQLGRFATPEAGFGLQALWRGQRVAGIGLVGCGSTITYEWGYTSADPEHRSLPLHHALQWQAIQQAKALGYHRYDLGGYWSDLGATNPINRFKLGLSSNQQRGCNPYMFCWRPRITRLLSTLRG